MSYLDQMERRLDRQAGESEVLAAPTTYKAIQARGGEGPKAWELDPLDFETAYLGDELATLQHPGTAGLDFETLRRMARVPLISAIINTRVAQLAEFAVPREKHGLGYKIALRDSEKEPTEAERRRAQELTEWLETCGNPEVHSDPLTFEQFVRMVARDSLIFDQATFEVVPTRGGKPAAIVPVDAATVRRARISSWERETGRRDPDRGFVQIISNQVRARFTAEELVFGVRRPRTWVGARGYGYPELEELVRTVTYLVNAEDYNANNFRHGVHVNGVLAVKSGMKRSLFRAFQREFYAMLSGTKGAQKTPIIQLDPEKQEELQSLNLSATNREMEYEKWISWLLKVACAIYLIDPAELGYQYGNEHQRQTLSQAGPGERVLMSRERGLRPMLRSLQSWLNRYVIHKLDPAFELRFVGFDAQSEREKLEADIKAVTHFKTINEVRAERDLPPLESAAGDMILNPNYISAVQAEQMMGSGAPEQEEEGAEDVEGMSAEELAELLAEEDADADVS